MFNWLKKTAVTAKVAPEPNVAAIQNGSSIAQLEISESETLKNQGNAHLSNGQLEDAAECYRQAIALTPHYAEAYSNLGYVFEVQGNLDEAVVHYRKATECNSNLLPAHQNLGFALLNLGQNDAAEESLLRVIALAPEHATALQSLGVIAAQRGDFLQAETLLRRALELQPDFADAHSNLGNTLKGLDRLNEAEASYRRATQINPDYADAHNNLGLTLKELGRLDEAEASYRRAIQINPNYAEAHNNLGNALNGLGRLDEAETCYRQALQIKPDYAEAHSNLIFTLDLKVGAGIAFLQEERKRWNAAHAIHLHQQRVHFNIPAPERRLRIGYVSADFRMHSATVAFGAMLVNFDPSRFDVIAYSNTTKEDAMTRIFQQSATCWRKIVGLSDDAVADLIRQDEIDILVDLSGHSAGNRLLLFARKPAPIQITAWGYASSTGLTAMDVFFADPVVVPLEERQFYTEQVRYLPNVVGHFSHHVYPTVNALPALSTKGIIFGSSNRLVKISEASYRTWAEVLLAIPRSRLILKTPELNDAAARERVAGHFTQAGVEADRIIMRGGTSWHEHMQAYNQIDIALDPFPHGGGVTALEGLMMGVPMINLRGSTVAGRLSASIMTTLGLPDWIAETQKEYVELAIQKADDLQSLAELRQQLRGTFTSSAIGDQAAYARVVEKEYRQLWQEWCASSEE